MPEPTLRRHIKLARDLEPFPDTAERMDRGEVTVQLRSQ